MDSAQDVPKNRIKAVRQPPPQRLSDRPAYQWPHRPAPAVNFPLEKPYNVIAGEGLCELRDNYNSIAPDTKAVNVKRRTSRFGLASLFSRSRAPDLERKQERLCIALEADEDPERLQPGECATSQPTGPSHVSKEFEALPPMESPDTHIRHRTSKPYLKAKPSFKKDISIKTCVLRVSLRNRSSASMPTETIVRSQDRIRTPRNLTPQEIQRRNG